MTGSLHDFIKENVLFTWQVYECAMREQTLQLAVKSHRLTSDVRLYMIRHLLSLPTI